MSIGAATPPWVYSPIHGDWSVPFCIYWLNFSCPLCIWNRTAKHFTPSSSKRGTNLDSSSVFPYIKYADFPIQPTMVERTEKLLMYISCFFQNTLLFFKTPKASPYMWILIRTSSYQEYSPNRWRTCHKQHKLNTEDSLQWRKEKALESITKD